MTDEERLMIARQWQQNALNGGCGPQMMLYFFAGALIAFCISCGTKKTIESTDTSDSVRVEYKEKIVEVPVEVYIEIPAESKERETKDSVSFLKTSLAQSEARLTWKDDVPYLFHSLENIPQRITKKDTIQTKETEKVIEKTHYKTIKKTEIREKKLTLWERLKIDYSGFVIFILLLVLVISEIRRRIVH